MLRTSNEAVVTNYPSSSTGASSGVVWTANAARCSFQVTVGSGFMAGSCVLQGSNDLPQGSSPTTFVPTNWTTIGSGSAAATVQCSNTSQGKGTFISPMYELSYEYVRVLFTDANSGNTNGLYSIRVKGLG